MPACLEATCNFVSREADSLPLISCVSVNQNVVEMCEVESLKHVTWKEKVNRSATAICS